MEGSNYILFFSDERKLIAFFLRESDREHVHNWGAGRETEGEEESESPH